MLIVEFYNNSFLNFYVNIFVIFVFGVVGVGELLGFYFNFYLFLGLDIDDGMVYYVLDVSKVVRDVFGVSVWVCFGFRALIFGE